ncbi:MAG: class II fumarate hydratase [Acidimicrobiia bacterium]|nr:class II fumarate hydratase [Acidimicrobiia bacterium]
MRIERDSMGEVQVPDDALYGASTQRAVDNFPISDLRFSRRMIWALGLIKGSAARVSGPAGHVSAETAKAISSAADEVRDGMLDDQFVLDIFQTGSGTSSNTNANEVIANRATQLMGGTFTEEKLAHPNDHVNFGQSSNDVIPTAIHVAAVAAIREDLVPALTNLEAALAAKAQEFDDVVKSGRTHLMDATPVTLGQEFNGYATQIRKGRERVERVLPELEELALGGTAVGTGLNAPDGFPAAVIADMAAVTGYPFREADDHFEAQAMKDATVSASGALKTVAQSMFKIANDLRWLSSGPRTGIAEIQLPSLQPGSSIMPGKVNPVMSEMVMQVAAQVIGNDSAITWGGANGNFELNVMMPLIAHNLLESISLLANAADTFRERCVDGIVANVDRARELAEANIIVVTALNPHIGYDNGAIAAKEAFASGRNVRDIVVEKGWLDAAQVDELLDIKRMTEGGVIE